MPIKDKTKYPADWRAISLRIRERAGQKCEWCGVPNGAIGYREANGAFVQLARSQSDAGMEVETASLDGLKVVTIVLTVAHYPDPNPANCDDSNLQALCQRCHNRLDAPMRAAHATATRQQKRRAAVLSSGQTELF